MVSPAGRIPGRNAGRCRLPRRNRAPISWRPGIWDRDCDVAGRQAFLLIAPAVTPVAGPQTPGGFLTLQTDAARAPVRSPRTSAAFAPGDDTASGRREERPRLADRLPVRRAERPNAGDSARALGSLDTPIEFPPQTHGACRAFVELRAAGKVSDRDSLVLGQAGRRAGGCPPARAPLPGCPTAWRASAMLVYAVPPAGLDGRPESAAAWTRPCSTATRSSRSNCPGRTWSRCRASISSTCWIKSSTWRKRKG